MKRVRDRLTGGDKSVLGAVLVLGGLFLFFGAVLQLPSRVLQDKGQTVTAVFTRTQLLTKGDEVRVKGVKVGLVRKLTLAPDGRTTTVEIDVDKAAQPVYADARASIEARTVLGANFALELDRGTPTAGELRGSIPISQTESPVELEDVANVFAGQAGLGFKSTLDQVPRALSDPKAPRDVLRAVRGSGKDIAEGIDALRGSDGTAVRRLVRHTDRVVRAVDAYDDGLEDLVSGAGRTVQTTAARAQDIRDTIRLGAPLTGQVTDVATRLDATLGRLDPLVARLNGSAAKVAPTLTLLRPTLVDADTLLTRARPLLRSLRPAVSSLAAASREGVPLLRGLTPSIVRLQDGILPDLALKSPETDHATYEMIGTAIGGLNAAFAHFDKNGHAVRFLASGGQRALGDAPCQAFLTDPTATQLVACRDLVKSVNTILGTKP